jgi:CDP-diacylglycerol--serine O-phosphatidyltransferase
MSVLSLFNLANMPNLINLFSGCMAVVFLFNYQMELVPYCVSRFRWWPIFLMALLHGLSKNPTDIGLQLDSLADVVSFGCSARAPFMFQLLFLKYEISDTSLFPLKRMYAVFMLPHLSVTLFAALRLAKFNVDTRQSEGFIGLATPAATMFVVGLLLLMFLNNTFGLTKLVFSW